MVTFTCELTRWSMVYFCKQKSQVKDRFKEYLEWVKRRGYVVKRLQSDGGGEYAANENARVLSDFQKSVWNNVSIISSPRHIRRRRMGWQSASIAR